PHVPPTAAGGSPGPGAPGRGRASERRTRRCTGPRGREVISWQPAQPAPAAGELEVRSGKGDAAHFQIYSLRKMSCVPFSFFFSDVDVSRCLIGWCSHPTLEDFTWDRRPFPSTTLCLHPTTPDD